MGCASGLPPDWWGRIVGPESGKRASPRCGLRWQNSVWASWVVPLDPVSASDAASLKMSRRSNSGDCGGCTRGAGRGGLRRRRWRRLPRL